MKKTAIAAALLVASTSAQADVLTFDWDGVFTMINPVGVALQNSDYAANDVGGYQTYISGTMSFDTATGAGAATVAPFDFFGGGSAIAHDITMQGIGDGNGGPGTLVAGNMLFDWSGNNNIGVELVMDAGGFFSSGIVDAAGNYTGMYGVGDALAAGPSAVAPGYEPMCAFGVGPVCYINLDAGPQLMSTVDGNPYATENVTILNDAGDLVFEGNRHTDGISGIRMDNGPFPGFNANFDVRAMTLTSATVAAVPVPAAVWLFGSGLVGLAGVARRRKTA